MTTFIMTGKYSAESIKQISGERTTKGVLIVQQCGGKFVAGYATMGETDVLAIVEFPGVSEAMKASV
ncbi:MAG: GYD domain-containing protein, partial [Actinomycetota bacterium]